MLDYNKKVSMKVRNRKILINNLIIQASVGVYEHEKQFKQKIIVNVELLLSNDTEPKNPYNRIVISKKIKDLGIQMWQELNKKKDTSNYVNSNNTKDLKHQVRNKCLMVLQKIDMFGYQTNMDWIMNLPISRVRQLFKCIKNQWNYKAGLSEEVKQRIYPNGNPFHEINSRRIENINRYIVLNTVLDLMDLIISNGVSNDDKNQGCILVLFALNDVNRECGRCNPWLI